MSYEIDGVDFYTLSEIAKLTNKSKQTIVRWYESGKIPEPSRMASNGWRIYSEDEKDIIVNFANKIITSPSQRKLL